MRTIRGDRTTRLSSSGRPLTLADSWVHEADWAYEETNEQDTANNQCNPSQFIRVQS
jgi:hypothetical protein